MIASWLEVDDEAMEEVESEEENGLAFGLRYFLSPALLASEDRFGFEVEVKVRVELEVESELEECEMPAMTPAFD